jgi:hypothetical protein
MIFTASNVVGEFSAKYLWLASLAIPPGISLAICHPSYLRWACMLSICNHLSIGVYS